MSDLCALCGSEIRGDAVETAGGKVFCCAGCRNVQRTLRNGDEADSRDRTATARNDSGPPPGTERSFLRIDGMHSATCEAFLESVAESRSGVVAAEASYVTETVRVDHDPDETSKRDLRDALSTIGYTAYLRTEAADTNDGSTGGTRRSREVEGMRKRRSDEILGLRYAAGIVFGAFLLIPYVALLYPAHLATFIDSSFLDTFEGTFELSGSSGFLFLRIYFVLTGIILFFTGMPVLRGAYTSLKMRRPNTDLLVAITVLSAFVYGTGAVLVGRNDIYYDLTLVIAAVVTGVTFYETSIKQRALDRLTELTVSQVDEARRYEPEGVTSQVPLDDLEPGDRLLVREGERVPVDGSLDSDVCTVEEAVVTGEALPVVKRAGDEIIGGSVVTDGAAVVTVGDPVASSIDRITNAVWNIQSADHGVQQRADQLTGYIVPVVVSAAIVVGGFSVVTGSSLPEAILATLLTLLVGSPWALGLATPLSVATSIRDAMDRGIVVFDETIFERLRDADVVIFDKTGTLTTGEMDVIEADAPTELLTAAAALEQRASHPAATAIVSAFAPQSVTNAPTEADPLERADPSVERDGPEDTGHEVSIEEFRTHVGGVSGRVDERELLVGNLDLFVEQEWSVADEIEERVNEVLGSGRLPVLVGRDGHAEGIVVVGDEPRAGWEDTVAGLAERGVEVVILTGDDAEATEVFSRNEAVTNVFAGVPPAGKTATVRRLQHDNRVAMVGDGTNDAPALARADLGISLGSGTALAADAADVAIADDDLSSVETAFDMAGATRRRIRQNLGLALVYNAVAIPAAVVGLFNPLTAAVSVAICGGLIAFNSSRDILE